MLGSLYFVLAKGPAIVIGDSFFVRAFIIPHAAVAVYLRARHSITHQSPGGPSPPAFPFFPFAFFAMFVLSSCPLPPQQPPTPALKKNQKRRNECFDVNPRYSPRR
jgi:hypothetical protein